MNPQTLPATPLLGLALVAGIRLCVLIQELVTTSLLAGSCVTSSWHRLSSVVELNALHRHIVSDVNQVELN